jgi:hypothetical protein
MTFHAFLGVLSAVIIGLAVVKLLQGILWMIHGRGQIKVYWVHLVWIGVAIFGAFLHFWNIVKQRNIFGDVNFYGVADMLWLPMLFYILAGLLFPPSAEDHSGDDRPVDLRDFYYENRAWIFGTLMVNWLTNAGNLRRIITQPLEWDTLQILPSALMYGALAVTRNKWVHMVIAALIPPSLFLLILFRGSSW